MNINNAPESAVNMAALHSADVAEYLQSADRRIVCGFRAALEVLGIPVPEAAFRKPTGRPRMADIAKAFHADNPAEAAKYNQQKAAAVLKRSQARAEARNAR